MVDTVTGARIHVAVDLPEGACFIHCDRSQFETALVNMAVNARDAMDGEGTLTLRLTCDAPLPAIRGHAGSRSHFAAVALADTGTGIAAGRSTGSSSRSSRPRRSARGPVGPIPGVRVR